jgi:hypothetical protein
MNQFIILISLLLTGCKYEPPPNVQEIAKVGDCTLYKVNSVSVYTTICSDRSAETNWRTQKRVGKVTHSEEHRVETRIGGSP